MSEKHNQQKEKGNSVGYSARFGLFRMDPADPELKRVPTPAVAVFQEFAKKLAAAGKG